MRLCHLANAASIHTRRVVAYLIQRGHSVEIVSFVPSAFDGARVHHMRPPIPGLKASYLTLIPRVAAVLRRIQPDILHAHYVASYGFIGAATRYRPLVVSAWGSDILIAPKKSLARRLLVDYALRRADLIHSVARNLTDEIVDRGVARSKIATFPYGLELTTFAELRRTPKNETATVISTRSLEPLYGVERLLHAVPYIVSRRPDVRFQILGDGSERPRLRRQVDAVGLGAQVQFLGRYEPDRRYLERLREACVYVSCSASDGTSASLLEAMAAGVFPVVSDIPANREWIEDGVNGYLVDSQRPQLLAERVLAALEDSALRLKADERNWEILASRASLDKNMRRLEEYYLALARSC